MRGKREKREKGWKGEREGGICYSRKIVLM
jgi:hypothetical protein